MTVRVVREILKAHTFIMAAHSRNIILAIIKNEFEEYETSITIEKQRKKLL